MVLKQKLFFAIFIFLVFFFLLICKPSFIHAATPKCEDRGITINYKIIPQSNNPVVIWKPVTVSFEISGLKIIGAKGFMIYPIGEATPKIADSNAKSLKMLIKKLEHEMAKEKEKKPTLLQIIQFYGLKLNCNFGKDVYKADHEYFQHKRYHKEIKINPVKELFGKILYKIGTAALRSSVNLEKRT